MFGVVWTGVARHTLHVHTALDFVHHLTCLFTANQCMSYHMVMQNVKNRQWAHNLLDSSSLPVTSVSLNSCLFAQLHWHDNKFTKRVTLRKEVQKEKITERTSILNATLPFTAAISPCLGVRPYVWEDFNVLLGKRLSFLPKLQDSVGVSHYIFTKIMPKENIHKM